MSESIADQLATLIAKLQTQRQQHQDAIANIDATFEQFGIVAGPAKKRRGRPRKTTKAAKPVMPMAAAKPAKPARGKRSKFPVSGLDSVLAFVRKAGKKGATGAEIIKHWKSDGRSGNGYKTLGELVKAKKLKREKIEGAQGSRYTVV